MAARKTQNSRHKSQNDREIDLTLAFAQQMTQHLCDSNLTPGQIEDICIASLSLYGEKLRRLCKASQQSKVSSSPA